MRRYIFGPLKIRLYSNHTGQTICLVPLFQREAWCTAFHVKMSFICNAVLCEQKLQQTAHRCLYYSPIGFRIRAILFSWILMMCRSNCSGRKIYPIQRVSLFRTRSAPGKLCAEISVSCTNKKSLKKLFGIVWPCSFREKQSSISSRTRNVL